jgi:serine-type D-Ala-D-Ala carboxypeptidase (penicillin-binding protein 5/6)
MPRRRPRRSLATAVAAVSASSLSAVLLAGPSAQAVSAHAVSAQAMSAQVGALARAGSSRPAGIRAIAGKLVNVRTGKDLWARQEAIQRPIASLTKVMTALVVIRAGDLRRRITITQAEVNYVQTYGASNAGLHAGDILTARALLYGMLLPSGADAAMALAQSYGPGIPAFVRKMNALARKLHMSNSYFTNFDGLQQSDVSTPGDLIRLGVAAMREAVFRGVVDRRSWSLPAWPHRHHYFWRNSNLLLKFFPGVIGIKTGWTPSAGECLLFYAVHRKKVLIGVILDSSPTNSGWTFVDGVKLLNWGFGMHVPVPPPTPPPVTPRLAIGG